MPSTYTTNLGIEKIASGDQSGTWGTTTNTNFDILDQGVNGIVQITLASAGTSGSPNSLPITNGAVSDGRNKFIEFVDGGDLGATAYVQLTPNDAEKIVFIRNSLSGSRSIIVFQGTYNASNDFEIANGKDVVLKFNGGGTGATVTQVFDDLLVSALSTTTLNLGGTAVTSTAAELNILDGVTATTAELNYVDGVTSNIQTQLDAKAAASNPTFTGTVTIATADINGGNIDGTAIGAASASTGNFSTLSIAGTAVTSTAAELNILDGVTATTAELNILDGVTATTTELNYVDGVTSAIQTQLNTKATIASPTFTGTSTVPSLVLGSGSTVTSIKDEDNMASNSNTALATQQSIKAYVDNSAVDLTAITTNVLPNTDDNNDLGSSTKRWQDLYLSNGVVFGAVTGSIDSKTLDDYEQGTFSTTTNNDPDGGTVSTREGWYIKIGKKVTIFYKLTGTIMSVSASQPFADFSPLPFQPDTSRSGTYAGSFADGATWGSRTDRAFSATVFGTASLSFVVIGQTGGYTFSDIVATVTYETA